MFHPRCLTKPPLPLRIFNSFPRLGEATALPGMTRNRRFLVIWLHGGKFGSVFIES